MNVNIYYTKAYNNETASGSGKNKPNSKPVLSAVEWANFRKAKMNKKSLAGKSGQTPFDFQSIKRYDGYRLAHIIVAVSL